MENSNKKYIIITLATVAALLAAYLVYSLFAYGSPLVKSINEHLISGNGLHNDSLYDDAMVEYGRAYSMDTTNAVSAYNNGTNLLLKNYQDIRSRNGQETMINDTLVYMRYLESERMLLKSSEESKMSEDKELLAKSSHNLGLTYHQLEQLKEAESAYKEALRNDPKNENTRYNLAVVQYLLKQKQNQEQNQDQNQDKQQQQNQDQQQQEQQQQEQQNKQQEQQQNQNRQQQQQQDKKENYERMLEALMQDEKELRDEMEKKAAQGIKIDLEKNW